jgi:terminase large subunit-like protein
MAMTNLKDALTRELGTLYGPYELGLAERRTTKFCDACITNQKLRGKGTFYPKCSRGADELAEVLTQSLSNPAQAQLLASTIDPVLWAKQEFNWEARWYQAQALRCTSTYQALRWGRRTGKSHYLAMRSLHLCATKPGVGETDPYTVLIVTPYEDQLVRIFEMARNALAVSRSFRCTHDKQNPQLLEFGNGSKMIGFTAGEKTGARSVKIRGQDANALVIDEADRLKQEDVNAVLAILASHAGCMLFFSSTPTGLPTKFREACEDPILGFREFWFASQESPEYSEDVDTRMFKRMFSRIEYEHEILAIFGLPEGGVFLPDHVHACTKNYPLGQELVQGEYAVIGVDCNDAKNGTHAVVLGVRAKPFHVRVIDKKILSGADFSNTKSEQMLLWLFHKWKPVILSLDKGYAHRQIESLIEYGLAHPELGLSEAIKYYDLGASFKFTDPVTGQQISRPYKPLMVGLTQRLVQEGQIDIPNVEDYESGLIGQMKRFHILRTSRTGQPVYSGDNDHTLTALMVGVLGWVIEVEGFEPEVGESKLVAIAPPKLPDGLPMPVSLRTKSEREIYGELPLDREPTSRLALSWPRRTLSERSRPKDGMRRRMF